MFGPKSMVSNNYYFSVGVSIAASKDLTRGVHGILYRLANSQLQLALFIGR